jgi:hypothetical protein
MKKFVKYISAVCLMAAVMGCQQEAEMPYGELYLLTDTIKFGDNARFGYNGDGFYYVLETGELRKRYTEERQDSAMVMESIALPYHNPDIDTSFIGYQYTADFVGSDTTFKAKLLITNVADDGADMARYETPEITVVVVK